MSVMRVAYVYPGPRAETVERVAAGREPDTFLLGLNHMADHGVDAYWHEPILSPRPWMGSRLSAAAQSVRQVPIPLEVRGADAVFTPLHGLFPLLDGMRRRKRVIVMGTGALCNAYRRMTGRGRAVTRAGLHRAAAVVCVAESQRRDLIELTGIDPGRVHVALFGVDLAFHVATELPADGYVLAVGKDPGRDFRTFVTAVQGLDARVVLVCGARNMDGIEVPSNVEVVFDLPSYQLRELYHGARCVVVPTKGSHRGSDCSGQTVLLDGMANARPVVVSERPSLDDYIDGGRLALTVPVADPDALRAEIVRVLADDALARSLGSRGRAAVEGRFNTRRFAADLVTVLDGAIAAPRPA